ncbi:MAG: FemAB family XrtA/PEP-CTERM system-associated protein [Gammaproteobacteria bacterium]
MKKPDRKEILSSPVTSFKQLHPLATEKQISSLDGLRAEYSVQKEHYEAVQNQARAISRQIGEAKRRGESTGHLILFMQELTARLKSNDAEISDLENRILGFFESSDESAPRADQPDTLSAARAYSRRIHDRNGISVSLLTNEQHEWNDYVAGNPAASLYHRVEWQALIQKTFGHEGFYFLARRPDGDIAGILPLVRMKSRLFGDFLVSMPYFNYGGAIADEECIEDMLMQAANEQATKLGVSHIEYRDDIPRTGLPVRTSKVNMILPLPRDEESLWEGFSSKLRSQIRRPQRETLETLCGSEEHLDDFYAVFSRNMRDLGTPVYAKVFFRNILHCFPRESRILVIRMKNRPVAAGFLIGHRDRLEIPWASSAREANPLGVNMYFYWKVLQYAVDNHYCYFDFGRSSTGSGTYRFKEQWGAQPKQLYWHYHLNENRELPTLNPENPKYFLAVNIWKRLPLILTNRLGPLIVRNLP